MNHLHIEITDVRQGHFSVRSNYGIRVNTAQLGGKEMVLYIYEGFEIDMDQQPLFSATLGPRTPDDHEDGDTFEYEDGQLVRHKGREVRPHHAH